MIMKTFERVYMIPKIATLCFLFVVAISFSADQSITVDRYGRRIQLDSFLMEWNAKTAQIMKDNNNREWHFDAINTPEGLAGYFRSDSAAPCSSWTFILDPHSDVKTIQLKIPTEGNEFYKYDKKLYDSLKVIALEWLIPWEQIGYDSTGAYAFLLTGVSECGDSLPSLLITGTKTEKKAMFSAALIIRAVLILLLIILYVVLNIKLRNRALKKKAQLKKNT